MSNVEQYPQSLNTLGLQTYPLKLGLKQIYKSLLNPKTHWADHSRQAQLQCSFQTKSGFAQINVGGGRQCKESSTCEAAGFFFLSGRL